MWKLVIILENPFQSRGILASRRFDGNFLVHRRSPQKQKQRQGGRVCCANLVIVWQIYDLQLHRAVIAFFYYISYIGIHCQYDGSSSLTDAA